MKLSADDERKLAELYEQLREVYLQLAPGRAFEVYVSRTRGGEADWKILKPIFPSERTS